MQQTKIAKLKFQIFILKIRLVWNILKQRKIDFLKRRQIKRIVDVILSTNKDTQEKAIKYIMEGASSPETKEMIKAELEKARK